jgi:hypothetical protein
MAIISNQQNSSWINRPFEGGFEATTGISMAIYHHVVYPLALDQVHAQTKQLVLPK